MTIADVIQIILGVLSLIATVAVSVVIARVETKRAKRQHTEAIQQQVKEFIFSLRIDLLSGKIMQKIARKLQL